MLSLGGNDDGEMNELHAWVVLVKHAQDIPYAHGYIYKRGSEERVENKGLGASTRQRGIRLKMRKVKKRVTDKIMRKAGVYGWRRRMPGGDRELISKGRKKTSQL